MNLDFPHPPQRIYLVGSNRVGWQALRTLVREIEGIAVVGETQDARWAVRAVAEIQPDGVLVALDVGYTSIVELVARLRESCVRTKLFVFGSQVGYELEMALAGLEVDGFLLWEDVTPEAVSACLYSVLVAKVRVASAGVVRAIVANSKHRDLALLFTEQQRLVLQGLAAAREEADIATETGLGLRTVERRIGELKALLGATTLAELASKARAMGFGQDAGR